MQNVTSYDVGGPQPYQVLVGRGALAELPNLLVDARQVAVIFTRPLAPLAAQVVDMLESRGLVVLALEIPDAEAGKRIEVVADCWDRLGAAEFTEDDAVVAVGGGALTDAAGFVASRWLGGIRWVPVATSIVNMVDAAIGSKTGINTNSGKNLVGAFHAPQGVICDIRVLETLSRDELAGGFAEIVKCGFIVDTAILDIVEADPVATLDPHSDVLFDLICRAVRVKTDIVSTDTFERGRRQFLNYGHTFGHAIEKVEHYLWRHGHAVAVGMVFAAELAHRAERLDADGLARHRSILGLLGLPTKYGGGNWEALLNAMRVDKKASGKKLRFVVLDGVGNPGYFDDPPDDLLHEVYGRVGR